MKIAGRIISVLLVLIVAGILLYPTVKWYFFVPEEAKSLAEGSSDAIRLYAKGEAEKTVSALLSISERASALPSEYRFLKDIVKEKTGTKVKTVADVLASFSSRDALTSAVEGYYREKVLNLKALGGRVLQLGLDLKGGVSVLLEADRESYEQDLGRSANGEEITQALREDIDILSSRLDEFGLSEPDIRLVGDEYIQIELPGESNADRVDSLLHGKGSLRFMLVDMGLTNSLNSYYSSSLASAFDENGNVIRPPFIPETYQLAGYYLKDEYDSDRLQRLVVLDPSVSMSGDSVRSASASRDSMTSRPVVNFTLSAEGGREFYDLTSSHIGSSLAVVLDGKVRSVATINDAISSNVQISGFSESEAQDLEVVLKSASFPIELNIASSQTVGATLGEDAVRAGVTAICIGLALIFVFMFLYYGLSGLVAVLALLLDLFIMFSLLSAMRFTLTLTAIAGLILTLGMAVDSNVIIYERIKEELREGKKPANAVAAAYSRAFWTILDSNITTIIAALVLSMLGSSSVKGFAITLAVGIATSLFTSLYVSRLVFDLFVREESVYISVSPIWRKK